MVTGDYCQINGVVGPSSINAQWQVTVTGANTCTLNGSSDATAYVSGGVLSGSDLYAVDAVERAYANPNGCPYTTVSANTVTVTPTVSAIYVPAAFVADYKTKVVLALAAFFANFPLGGINVDAATNILPISAIEGVLYAAGQQSGAIYTLSVSGLQLNGGLADISLGTPGNAVLGSTAALLANVVGV
jgi:hypothetical protein